MFKEQVSKNQKTDKNSGASRATFVEKVSGDRDNSKSDINTSMLYYDSFKKADMVNVGNSSSFIKFYNKKLEGIYGDNAKELKEAQDSLQSTVQNTLESTKAGSNNSYQNIYRESLKDLAQIIFVSNGLEQRLGKDDESSGLRTEKQNLEDKFDGLFENSMRLASQVR